MLSEQNLFVCGGLTVMCYITLEGTCYLRLWCISFQAFSAWGGLRVLDDVKWVTRCTAQQLVCTQEHCTVIPRPVMKRC